MDRIQNMDIKRNLMKNIIYWYFMKIYGSVESSDVKCMRNKIQLKTIKTLFFLPFVRNKKLFEFD